MKFVLGVTILIIIFEDRLHGVSFSMHKTKEIKMSRKTKKEMIEFLKNHERYWTMNSWNGSSSYANNVKVYNLGMDHDLEIKAYELLAEEGFYDLLASNYEFLIERFEEETGYTIGFNGRSSGYLVLYDKEHPATSIDSHEDFEGWNRAEVEERYNLVKRFDDYCGYFVDDFKDIVENVTIREEDVITKVKVFDFD